MNTFFKYNGAWMTIKNVNEIPSPALLVYPERVKFNIQKMIEIAGGVERLRPHVKTHKMAPIISMQIQSGIDQFKCSTIAEAELTSRSGAKDILLALQPVGPNIDRLFRLMDTYPNVKFSSIVDNQNIINAIEERAKSTGRIVTLYLDVDNGMHRSGSPCDNEAVKLYQYLDSSDHLEAGGLHVYDGHIREPKFEKRQEICDHAFACILTLINTLRNTGIVVPKIIAGGSPTFPVHARRSSVELSPGTTLLWDWGYSEKFADLDFQHAAVILLRVISKPRNNTLCLDLGHKAIAAEMAQPRIKLMGINEYNITTHSEEHMVVETPEANQWQVGDHLYGIPMHICPTVDRQEKVFVVENNEVVDQWFVEGRKRMISI